LFRVAHPICIPTCGRGKTRTNEDIEDEFAWDEIWFGDWPGVSGNGSLVVKLSDFGVAGHFVEVLGVV
jgi:hypothetical protein